MILTSGPSVTRWVTERLGVHPLAYGSNPDCIGLLDHEGRHLRAGVVYCSSNGVNLHAHIATDGSKRWATRRFLRTIFAYPFEILRVNRITATTPKGNVVARKFLFDLGFVKEFEMAGAASNGQALLGYRMFKRECPWL